MLGIFTLVIPKIAVVFRSMNRKMPWYTEMIMNISNFLVNYWWAVLFGIALVAFGALRRKS